MQSSNLSFLIWYKTMFLMTATKKGFSSKEIQKQLGLKRYEPVWAMVHKLRKAMGNRDARYTLQGMIEFDEGYFTVESSEIEQEKGIRGRGAVGKSNVAIMAESTVLEDIETGEKSNQCRYFKAKVLKDHTSEQINETILESISEKSILFTDKSTSYIDIADYVEIHITEKSNKETTTETLRWVHIAISNAKRNFLGNYHKIKGKYLQLYLNEFVYKLNRRYFEEKLFDRLVIAGITGLWQKTDNQKAIAEYQKNKRIVLENIKIAIESNSLKADEIIKELFEKAEIIEANESLINSAKVRFDLGNPPGKNNSYGDALNWETLLQDTSIDKDLIFISDDKDYFSEIDNAKFNKYLEREWENRKNSKIIFFKSISEFFKSKYPNIKLASDLQKDVYIEHLQNSNTFRDSRYNLHKLSKFNDFTSDQINSIFFQTFSNTQLYWISEDEDINEILYDLYDKYNSVMDEFIKTEFLSKVKRIKQIDNENESEDDFPF